MKTFRFLDFSVYIRARALYKEVLRVTELMRDFALKDQARRAALSIILNIAEGSAKKSDREFSRFLQIALGSVNELYACLDAMKENKLVSESNFRRLEIECEEIAKQLGGFSKKLRVNC